MASCLPEMRITRNDGKGKTLRIAPLARLVLRKRAVPRLPDARGGWHEL